MMPRAADYPTPHAFAKASNPYAWALWHQVIAALRAEARMERMFLPLIEAYVRALDLARTAREQVETEGLKVEGSQGQWVAHPSVAIERAAVRDAVDYGKELLLTPAARKRHEIEAKPTGGRRQPRLAGVVPGAQ